MLTKAIAANIVAETSHLLHHHVNIMDHTGLIIASSDPTRLHTVHEGARQVIETGQPFIIYKREIGLFKGSQPGVNLPIVFDSAIVGVVGITGDPHQLKDIGGLVKMTAELMIQQEQAASQAEWTQRTKEMILEELLKKEPDYAYIQRGFSLLNVNMRAPFLLCLIQFSPERKTPNQLVVERAEKEIVRHTGFAGFTQTHHLVLLLSADDRMPSAQIARSVQRSLHKTKDEFRMAVSHPFPHVSACQKAYSECGLALFLSNEQEEVVLYDQIEAQGLLYHTDPAEATLFASHVLDRLDEKEMDTLKCLFHHDLHLQKTADHLFVHRNTLLYRLDKIKERTGYDPRRFQDALTLQLALWVWQLHNKTGPR